MKFTPLLLLLLIFGCSKNEPAADRSLTLSANSIRLGGTVGSTNTFSVTTNGSWTATASPGGIIQVSPSSGTGTSNLTITVLQANTSSGARTITITVSVGNTTQQIVVTQDPVNQNWKNFLVGNNGDEAIYKSILNQDGSMLHVGYEYGSGAAYPNNKGDKDMLLIKTDNQGKVVWSKTYGGTDEDILYSCLSVSGGYLVTGHTRSNSGDFTGSKGGIDAVLMKIDENGNIVWMKRFGGSREDAFFEFCLSADAKLYAVGKSESIDGDLPLSTGLKALEIWVAKFDLNGNLLQSLVFGNRNSDQGFDIEINAGNELFVTGIVQSSVSDVSNDFPLTSAESNFFVMKLDPQGKMIWNKAAGGGGPDQGTALLPLDDGGVVTNVFVGSQDFPGTTSLGGTDGLVIRYNKDGQLLWQKRVGGVGDDAIDNISKSGSDKFVVAGYSKSIADNNSSTRSTYDGWVFQMNLSGVMEWQEFTGGSSDDFVYSVIPGPNSRVYFSGKSLSPNLPGTVYGGGNLADGWYGYIVK